MIRGIDCCTRGGRDFTIMNNTFACLVEVKDWNHRQQGKSDPPGKSLPGAGIKYFLKYTRRSDCGKPVFGWTFTCRRK
jgi:hypothetical protein